MLRSLRLVNLLLGLVAALIASALAKTWVVSDAPVSSPAITKPAPEVEALAYKQTTRPPLAQYDLLVEKSPFKQPPPVPARASGVAPLPPLPLLTGTILIDSERRAILSEKGKSSFYSVGQAVAGGVITEIKQDRVMLKRGDTTSEIMLKAAIESSGATPAAGSGLAATPAAGLAPSSGPSEPSPATLGLPPPLTPGAGKEERMRERMQQREQRRQMREQQRAGKQGAR